MGPIARPDVTPPGEPDDRALIEPGNASELLAALSVGRARSRPRARHRRSILAELPAEDAAALAEAGRRTSVRAGRSLVGQGEPDPPAVVVETGHLGLRHRAAGRRVLLHLLGPGDVACPCAVLPAPHDVVALEPATTLVIPAHDWERLIAARACIAAAALSRALDLAASADARRIEAASRPAAARLAAGLLQLAELHGRAVPDGIRIEVPLAQHDLASWVHASQTATATALRSLRAAGAVRTERRSITVTRPAALRALAEG